MADADRIADLEARIAYLESELGLVIARDHVHLVRRALAVTQSHAHFLLTLYRCRPRSLTYDQLDERIPPVAGRGEAPRNTIRAFAMQIRKRLGPDVIETVGGGYRLGPRGLILVGQAVEPLQAAA